MKEVAGRKISEVRLSQRLKSHPVCLASGGGISIEMEKSSMQCRRTTRSSGEVLEINASHPVLEALKAAFGTDRDKQSNIQSCFTTRRC